MDNTIFKVFWSITIHIKITNRSTFLKLSNQFTIAIKSYLIYIYKGNRNIAAEFAFYLS